MRTEKEVADDIAKMCFRKSIEKQKESYDLLNFDCKEVSNFVRGEAFAYSKMNLMMKGKKNERMDSYCRAVARIRGRCTGVQ